MRARGIGGILLVAACLGAALACRRALEEARRDLDLARADITDAPAPAAAAGREIAAAAAGLGVFRALAVDFLWLRAIRLQRKGEYFESEALARLILRLQPRIAAAWTFQAEQLAYDIPPSFPPRERWPWVLSGIALLRDDALALNPGSLAVHAALGKIFYHKIGQDFDEAGPLYRSELAIAFDLERGSPEWTGRLAEWRMDPARWKRIEEELGPGIVLDLRASGSHALYWAAAGLAERREDGRGLAVTLLEGYRLGAILQLHSGGRPIRAAAGRSFAFLPDLRLDDAARAVVEAALAERQIAPEVAADFAWRSISYVWLSGDTALAERRFAEEARRWPSPPASVGDLVADVIFPDVHEGKREALLEALAASIEAPALLEASGEPAFARGFKALAATIHARCEAALGRGAVPPLADCVRAVRSRLASRWEADARTRPLAADVRGEGAEAVSPPAGLLDLPSPQELPFRLDALDPLREPGGVRP
jgi:hypothetical protein